MGRNTGTTVYITEIKSGRFLHKVEPGILTGHRYLTEHHIVATGILSENGFFRFTTYSKRRFQIDYVEIRSRFDNSHRYRSQSATIVRQGYSSLGAYLGGRQHCHFCRFPVNYFYRRRIHGETFAGRQCDGSIEIHRSELQPGAVLLHSLFFHYLNRNRTKLYRRCIGDIGCFYYFILAIRECKRFIAKDTGSA